MAPQAFRPACDNGSVRYLETLQLWATLTCPTWNSNDKEETNACLE